MTDSASSAASSSPEEPLLDVAHGDVAESRQLRRALQVLRDQAADDGFRNILDDVLAGRSGLREAFMSPEFASGLDPLVGQFAAQYEALSDQEREQLVEQGKQELEQERERISQEQQRLAQQRAERERNDR